MRENREFYAGVYDPRRERADRVRAVAEALHLQGREKDLAGDLSGGWRQRLALGTALVHQPRLLFLDEPTKGEIGSNVFSHKNELFNLFRMFSKGLFWIYPEDDIQFTTRL